MIIFVTDKLEPWLQFIWEQFVQINSLNTENKLVTYSNFNLSKYKTDTFVIEYGSSQKYSKSLFVPQRKTFKTDAYIWLQDNLPVFRDTIIGNTYDIFYNAFVHLSRLEEWEAEKNGKFIRSYSFNHPRKVKRIWQIPVVNYLFNELERRIKLKFPQVSFGDHTKPIIEFSHDVDYISKTIQLRIKQSLFHFFNSAKFLMKLNIKTSLSKFIQGIRFALTNRDYWNFDYWDELEDKLNIKSAYYFYAKSANQKRLNFKRWLIDPSYDIRKNERFKNIFKKLINNGNKIGLHGSYFSAENEGLFKKEKEILEDSIGLGLTKSRQHWLNFYENRTPYIFETANIEEDSTLGFNDISGFRAGVASIYNPYDHQNNRPFKFKEIPLVVMDSHLYDYTNKISLNELRWLFNSLDDVKNFMVSVDWHERAISSEYSWEKNYKEIAAMVSNSNT